MNDTSLHIKLLGGFSVRHGDSQVAGLHQRKLQTLLAHILLHRHTPQSRQFVAFLFWPDSTEKQSRSNLRKLVYSLRRALPQADRYLEITTETIAWRLDAPHELDVSHLEAWSEAVSDDRRGMASQSALSQISVVYPGDLLPGFYDDWILIERDRLRTLYAESLNKLAAHFEQERNYSKAAAVAQRLLNLDPLQESSYRLLMRIHLQNQDKAAALMVYHNCTTMLRDELGVDPSPLTEELYLQILRAEAEDSLPIPTAAETAKFRLVGRRQALEQLFQSWQKAQKRQASLHLIQGEAGIGKTRLAQELADTVRRQGVIVKYTRAYVLEQALPYAPVAELIQSSFQEGALSNLADVWQIELSRLLPELRSERAGAAAPEPLSGSWQQHRFHEALVRGVLATGQPLLIHFDDLQWADPETLSWLQFLLSQKVHDRLLVVATVRSDEINEQHPLSILRYALERYGRCQVIDLDPLPLADAIQLAAEVTGHKPDTLDSNIIEEMEGNPLFLIELLRAARLQQGAESGLKADSILEKGSLPPIPAKIQAVIQWRLAQLGPDARQLVSLAAVIGRNFSHALLSKVSDLNEQLLVQNLDELWRRRLIREGDFGAYDFSHDLIREVANEQLSPMQLRLYHRRIAEGMEILTLPDHGQSDGQIARHYDLAGDSQRARPFFIQAGQYAAGQFANKEAVACFNRALELSSKNKESSSEIGALFVSLGRVLELDAQFQRAMSIYQEMEELARQWADQVMLLKSLVGQVALLATPTPLQNLVESERLVDQALDLASQLQDQEAEARILWLRLLVYSFTDRLQLAAEAGERALALVNNLDLPTRKAYILNDLGYHGYRRLGRLMEAKQALVKARDLWRELGNFPMLADNLSALCIVNIRIGAYEDAVTCSGEAYQISQTIDNLWGQSYSLLEIGWVHWEHGQPDRAIAVLEECISLGERAGFLGAQTTSRALLSLIYAGLGAFERSLEISAQAVSTAEAYASSDRWYVLGILATIHLRYGYLDQAEEIISLVKQGSRYRDRGTWSINSIEGELKLLQGDIPQALAITEELLADLQRTGRKSDLPHALHLHGQILRASGQRRAAAKRFKEALSAAEMLGSRRMLWRILMSLSELEKNPTNAKHLRQQAQEIVQYIVDHISEPVLRESFHGRLVISQVPRD